MVPQGLGYLPFTRRRFGLVIRSVKKRGEDGVDLVGGQQWGTVAKVG
jgi:hypothetical protein